MDFALKSPVARQSAAELAAGVSCDERRSVDLSGPTGFLGRSDVSKTSVSVTVRLTRVSAKIAEALRANPPPDSEGLRDSRHR
jgi:hypothetical protein